LNKYLYYTITITLLTLRYTTVKICNDNRLRSAGKKDTKKVKGVKSNGIARCSANYNVWRLHAVPARRTAMNDKNGNMNDIN